MRKVTDDIEKVLFNEEEIQARIKELSREIEESYKGKASLIVIGILKGASIFLTDLVRELEIPAMIDFMSVSSYGIGRVESTGAVKILKDLDYDIEGKDVLIVEDIIDSGLTLSYLSDLMKRRGAKTVKIASLLNKPSRRKNEVKVDFIGFEVPDVFIVGYGIDYSENYRNLSYVASLKEEVYK